MTEDKKTEKAGGKFYITNQHYFLATFSACRNYKVITFFNLDF